MGQYDQAIQDYTQVIELISGEWQAFTGRGNAESDKGEYNQAIVGQLQPALADCNQSLTLHPNNVDTLNSRCFLYSR